MNKDNLIIKFMKDNFCSLDFEDKWLVIDDITSEWRLYQHKYPGRTKLLLSTKNLEEALKLLKELEGK